MLLAVSLSDSPLVKLLDFSAIEIMSAPRLFVATSKVILVHVLGSKNKLTMRFPSRVGAVLLLLNLFCLNSEAKSSRCNISSTDKLWIPIKDFLFLPEITIKAFDPDCYPQNYFQLQASAWANYLFFQ